jgi:hypothetical protein
MGCAALDWDTSLSDVHAKRFRHPVCNRRTHRPSQTDRPERDVSVTPEHRHMFSGNFENNLTASGLGGGEHVFVHAR